MPNIVKLILSTLLYLMLSACGSLSGDWPNLAEPYPDASERDRVIERANPVAPTTMMHDDQPLTRSTAFKLLTSTRAQLKKANTEYLNIKAKIAAAVGDDKIDHWNEAQLSLTRLSHTASILDSILLSESLKAAPVFATTAALKSTQDIFLVTERKALAALKP